MKKIFCIIVTFLFLGFIFNNVMAAKDDNSTKAAPGVSGSECSGLLINTKYQTINAPDNNIYGVGDIVDTSLSFELDGEDGQSVSPLSIVLVMDNSGSMASRMGVYTKMDVAMDSLEGVVNYIHDLNTPDIKLALFYFNSWPTLKWPTWSGSGALEPINSSTNLSSLITAINATSARGGTHMGDAVHDALNLVNQGDSESKKVIIVASDGKSADSVSSADRSILKSSVTGYAIGIGNNYNYSQLLTVAGDNPDRVYDANSASQLEKALEDIMKDVIKFEASNLKVSFNITDLANSNLSLISATPPYSSISPDGKVLTWNLGNQEAGYIENINLKFKVNSAIASQLPINENILNFSYNDVNDDGASVTCTSLPPNGTLTQPSVPVINIFTHEIPTLLNFWSNPSSGSSIDEGQSLVLSWRTQNADKCISSSDDGISEWNGDEDAAEDADKNKTVYPAYTGFNRNVYKLRCQKTYDFGNGLIKTVYSNEEQVQIKVNPCTPTYTCLLDSIEDACASMPCGSSVTLNSTCRLINNCGGAYSSCSDAGLGADCVGKNDTCPDCKEVDEWIEVTP